MNEYEEHRWPYEYIYTTPFYVALLFRISKQLWMKEPSAKRISKFSCNNSHMALYGFKEKSVIDNHIFHNVTRFAVSVNEDQERLPTFYWLPKLHKKNI